MSARSGVNPGRRGSSTAEPATGRRKDWREEQLARRCMQRMEAGRDERKRQVAARRGSAAAGGGELVPMDAQALCKGIICAEMDDSWEGLSEDAYAELMYAAALLSLAGSHSACRGRRSRSRGRSPSRSHSASHSHSRSRSRSPSRSSSRSPSVSRSRGRSPRRCAVADRFMEQITVTLTLPLTLARYAMEQTLLREMREDVASLGAEAV